MVKVIVGTRKTSGWPGFNVEGSCCNFLLDKVADLRDYRIADLRNQFAMVLREPVLFSSSIAENIAYANPDATSEEIMAAAQAANAHEFITHLPEGYDTQVGERACASRGYGCRSRADE